MAHDIWFISDTHFFHDNIIQYCGRPFANSDLMNECIRDNWNSNVKPNDKVYHLGDVACGCKSEKEFVTFMFSLNGHKRLIPGNHDDWILNSDYARKPFEKIKYWFGFSNKETAFTAFHIPLPIEHLRDGEFQLHGHIHNALKADPRYINVCVEHIGYTPIHIDTIRSMIKSIEKHQSTNT